MEFLRGGAAIEHYPRPNQLVVGIREVNYSSRVGNVSVAKIQASAFRLIQDVPKTFKLLSTEGLVMFIG